MPHTLSYAGQETRKFDRDRFLCSLFASASSLEDIHTILAFNIEISKSREMVSEGLLGEMRLQWWRDIILSIYSKDTYFDTEHYLVSRLQSIIQRHKIESNLFLDLINARSWDMADDAPKNEADLISYSYGTTAILNRILIEIMRQSHESLSKNLIKISNHAGIAWSIAGIIRASSVLSKYKRIYIPISLMKKNNFTTYEFQSQKVTPGIKAAIGQLVLLAKDEVNQARKVSIDFDKRNYLPVLLQLSLADMYLSRIKYFNFDPFEPKIEKGRLIRQLILYIRARTGLL